MRIHRVVATKHIPYGLYGIGLRASEELRAAPDEVPSTSAPYYD